MSWHFSNFTKLSTPIEYGSLRFSTVEAFYQAMKTTNFELRKRISQMNSPREAKNAGQALALRENWEVIKLDVMELGLRLRLRFNPEDAKLLANTSGEIVEWVTWCDTYWGICTCKKHVELGLNNLGKLWMKLRDEIAPT